MSDITTDQLNQDTDNPRLARPSLLEAVLRVNQLTRFIDASGNALVAVGTNLSVTGDATITGNLTLGSAGQAGQVATSQGAGQPITWTTIVPGDRYKTSSVTSLNMDSAPTKTISVATGLSYTAGQSVIVSHDSSNYFRGVIQSYDDQTGQLTFSNDTRVGSGTFVTWTVNLTGVKGDKGDTGTAGATWYNGASAPSVATGVDNDYYINTANGDYYQKQAGAWTLLGNLTGPGGSGGSGTSSIYNTTSRYQANTTTGQGVSILSSATVKTGIAWTRSGTTLTINDTGHGRSVGERAILRNVNVANLDGLITSVTGNSFTMDCADTGATSGNAGAYSMGLTFAYTGATGSITGGTVVAPANCDVVLLAIRIHLAANTRGATTFNLTIPKGNINGAGPHTSMDNVFIPTPFVRQDGNTLSAVGSTIATNLSGDYGTYQFGALPAATTGIHIMANF